ncbi:DNA polymerase epsilon subunit 3 [Quaeritorhiza haematococci]|nr:DNA polymerase epsilon subunit 3 [Quaeritorhiza haematococci]
MSVEDLELPRTIINRVVKNALPENVLLQKDAKSALAKACTVFINYLTATANDLARQHNQKTVVASHIFNALETIEFDDFLPDLQQRYEFFHQYMQEKRTKVASKKKVQSQPGDGQGGPSHDDNDEGHEDSMDEDNGEKVVPQKRKSAGGSSSKAKVAKTEGARVSKSPDDEDEGGGAGSDDEVQNGPSDKAKMKFAFMSGGNQEASSSDDSSSSDGEDGSD